jgi:hypothetical protein
VLCFSSTRLLLGQRVLRTSHEGAAAGCAGCWLGRSLQVEGTSRTARSLWHFYIK